MATNFPIVRLKRAPGERAKLKGRKPRFPAKIPYGRQAQRLAQVFTKAEQSLAAYADGVDVAADPRAVVPERCLVFELLGDVPEFNLAAQALGLEWLATEATTGDAEEAEADDGADSRAPENQPPQRLYLTMPTEQALRRLLKQWKQYAWGEPYRDKGQRELWKLFDYLHDLRVWSVKDRLDPMLSAYVANILKDDPDEHVAVDLDLWYRNEDERRDKSLETLNEMLEDVGGELLVGWRPGSNRLLSTGEHSCGFLSAVARLTGHMTGPAAGVRPLASSRRCQFDSVRRKRTGIHCSATCAPLGLLATSLIASCSLTLHHDRPMSHWFCHAPPNNASSELNILLRAARLLVVGSGHCGSNVCFLLPARWVWLERNDRHSADDSNASCRYRKATHLLHRCTAAPQEV